MKKVIRGIVEFRKTGTADQRALFAQLALGQKPDTLFTACSDSRVAVNVFASTDPGDLFVVRNVGNMIPPADVDGLSLGDVSEPAAIEFALGGLNVSDIVVCGHSDCGAMKALLAGRHTVLGAPNLKRWLRSGERALQRLRSGEVLDETIAEVNQLSQLNVLQQLEHLKTYPLVKERLERGQVRLHGWWFDIAAAEVRAYEPDFKKFVAIDSKYAERLLERVK